MTICRVINYQGSHYKMKLFSGPQSDVKESACHILPNICIYDFSLQPSFLFIRCPTSPSCCISILAASHVLARSLILSKQIIKTGSTPISIVL